MLSEELVTTFLRLCTTFKSVITNSQPAEAHKDLNARALSLLIHHTMQKVGPIMEKQFGYFWFSRRQLVVDAEHALAAKCILAESGHVFTKSKRAHRVATNNGIKYPPDSEVLALEKTKDIGEIPKIMENRGHFNTLDCVHRCYFLSQAFIHKEGDIFLKIQMTTEK